MPPILPYIAALPITLSIGYLFVKINEVVGDKLYYLYLIPLQDGTYFKFGITNNLNRRLGEHERARYKFDRKQVLFIKQERKEVQKLETTLKNRLPVPKSYLFSHSGMKGATEVRHMRHIYKAKKLLKGYLIYKNDTDKK